MKSLPMHLITSATIAALITIGANTSRAATVLVAGEHDFTGGGTDFTILAGTTSTLSGGRSSSGIQNSQGSDDGTYGSLIDSTPIPGAGGVLAAIGTTPVNGTHQFRKRTQDAVGGAQATITITVINDSAGDLNLGLFHFDLGGGNDTDDFVTFGYIGSSGGLGATDVTVTTPGGVGPGVNTGDYDDFDWDLQAAGLDDTVLSNGETAAFFFRGNTTEPVTNAAFNFYIDNVLLVTHDPIPEPSAFLLFATALLGYTLRRKR
jgi:hypothetical protein